MFFFDELNANLNSKIILVFFVNFANLIIYKKNFLFVIILIKNCIFNQVKNLT